MLTLPSKEVIDFGAVLVALTVAVLGLIKFYDAVRIRRYEKFHEMSVRFDSDKAIQAVCGLLTGNPDPKEPVTKQQILVFICFVEEIEFMVKSDIMPREIALYTFGYYAKLAAARDTPFRTILAANEDDKKLIRHFEAFCDRALKYDPSLDEEAFRF